ncbi:MAG: heparinase II/III family protein [Bryobacterales bacterium]|nr:heparinase II/III family protein [Bryobacterales bacterium]
MLAFSRRALMPVLAAPSLFPAPLYKQRNILSKDWPAGKVAGALLPRNQWVPLPAASDREAWQSVAAAARTELLDAAAVYQKEPWASLPATVYLDFARNGNRSRYEAIRFARRRKLNTLAVAECIEGKGRFLDSVAEGVWLQCEESSWVLPAHIRVQKAGNGLPDVAEPVVDLFAAECGAQMSWIHYLLAPQLARVSPLLPKRIRHEVHHRILTPCLERDDFGWMGLRGPNHSLNNWTPWINSNWLTCALLLEEDTQRRAAHVAKSLRSVDEYLSDMPDDGGCDEGPGYWGRAGASLFDCLEILQSASAGRMVWWGDPLVREIGRYIVKAHIAGKWMVNFADASAHASPDGSLVWRYGKAIGDRDMMEYGAWAGRDQRGIESQDSPARTLMRLFHNKDMAQTTARAPLPAENWLPDLNVLFARQSAGSDRGFYLAAKGGHNAESHNHNDIGNYIVFHNGEPVLVDVGVETYSAKTFSSQRYEIWTMQSGWHNCPTINGRMQSPGRQHRANNVQFRGGATSEVTMDIAAAYPAEARVESFRRAMRLDRRQEAVVIEDAWKLAASGPIEWNFITPKKPVAASPGVIELPAGAVLRYDASQLDPSVDEHEAGDSRLRNIWGGTMYRVRLAARKPATEGRAAFTISRARA